MRAVGPSTGAAGSRTQQSVHEWAELSGPPLAPRDQVVVWQLTGQIDFVAGNSPASRRASQV